MEATAVKSQFQPGRAPVRNQGHKDAQVGRRPTITERRNREYSFPVEEIHDLFKGLWELKLIELPKSKRPEEANMFNAPNFCPYHCILGHTLDDCFVVKNII